MSEFKKLFQMKRILAIALAVAMTVTSAPVTAQAAPENPEQTETIVENDSTEESVEDAAAGTTAAVTDEDGAGTESDQTTATTQEDSDPADSADADASQPAPAADVVTQADAARTAASYSFRYDGDTQFKYGQNGNDISDDGEYLNNQFLGNFRLLADDESWEAYLTYTGNEIVSTVTYQWFGGDNKALGDAKLLSDAGKNPVDAGVYTLKLTLPKKDGDDGYAEVTKSFEFEIIKAEVTVSLASPASVAPGTNVADVPAPGATVRGSDNKNFTYVLDDKETADDDESKDNEVKLTPVVKDAETGATVTEGKLTADKEYVITATPEFIGAKKAENEKNYIFGTCTEQKLRIADLKKTRLSITLDDTKYTSPTKVTKDVVLANNTERTIHVIEAQTVAAAAVDSGKPAFKDPKLETPDGEDDKGNPKWKAVTADETLFEGAWYTAADYAAPWKEADKTFCSLTVGGKLDEAPTTAGAYVYRYSYKGDEKEYAESSADILVIVEVPEIVVQPTVAEGTKFFDGQPINEVIAKIGYELPYADGRKDADGKVQLFAVTENMWGTSYYDASKTQPYKPDFKLIVIAKDGTEIDTSDWGGKLVLIEDAEYFVRFNGSKAVYDAAGNVQNRRNIMEGVVEGVDSMNPDTCGFKVKTGEDVYEAYQLKIDVVKAGSKIVTDDITAGKTSEKLNVLDVFAKTYDGQKIFEDHAGYKKAKLDAGDADSNRDFTYTWQESSLDYDDLTSTYKDEEDGKDKFTYTEEEIEGSFSDRYIISPVNAGVYRLKITYEDPKAEKFAEPAYVYFVIKQQEIIFDVSEALKTTGITGYTNYYDVIENNRELLADTSITVAEAMSGKPSKSEDWKNKDAFSEAADYAYEVTWQVYEKLAEPDENGNTEKEYYGSLTPDAGKYVVKPLYVTLGRINSNGGFYSSYYYNINFAPMGDPKLMIPITVKEMGTEQIKFAGITTSEEGADALRTDKTYGDDSIHSKIQDKLAAFNAPITVGEDGKTKKADVTDATLTYTVRYFNVFNEIFEDEGFEYDTYYTATETETYDKLPTEAADWDWAKDSGYYSIRVDFEGNDKYAPLNNVLLAQIWVNQRELTLVLPTLEKTYETGEDLRAALDDAVESFKELEKAGLKGEILEADQKYFTKTKLPNGKQGYLAWYNDDYYAPEFMVYDNQDKQRYTYEDFEYTDWGDIAFSEVGDKRYSLQLVGAGLSGDAAVNYYVGEKADPASTPIKVGRGASDVWMNDGDGRGLDITDKVSDGTAPVAKDHQVTVQDAIPYTYNPEGNLVTITIQAPAEYRNSYLNWSNVSCKQSIKNNAKENLIGEISTSGKQLSFTYNATDKKDLHFSIRWAADYNEDFTFLFSKAEVLDDLRDAVAPKSLAFNAPLTSMVVGQTQDLDVKITKEQMSDVICLGYEVTTGKGEIMHVNERGKVTALKEGKATVEVFPMHLVNGKKERITTDAKGKPVKTAKVNITVKKVSAPKVTKVIAGDDDVEVQYALPNENDGYRREIYVLEGKNLKPDVFEKKLAGVDADAMKNEQWKGIFAVAPKFVNYSSESSYSNRLYDAKKHAYTNTVKWTISGLTPGKKDYTVYVRNVSAMRSLEDDCKVTLSYAGTAKGFTTTLIEASKIVATLNDSDVKWLKKGNYWYKYDEETQQPTVDDIRAASIIEYNVPLSQKSVQISLEALFRDEASDEEYLPLALKGSDKQKYTDPKIAYYFYEWIYDGYDARYGYRRTEENGYTTTSNIGTIAKNGKMTLKNVGTATIYAVDTVSGKSSESLVINVTAEANSITARKANMQVGQRIKLADLVDYKENALKLGQSYNDAYASIDVKAAKDSLGANENFTITDDGYLIAGGAGSAQFVLKDNNIKGEATIKVTAKALDAVKGLSAVNVIDNRFDVRFEMNPYAEAYRINIKDGRGTLIRGIYVENLPFNYNGEVLWDGVDQSYNGWTRDDYVNDDDWGTEFDWDYYYYNHDRENWYSFNSSCYANMIKGKMNLTYHIDKLTQSSKYTVEVTTLYKEVQPGKPATKAVTTTKMPAYDWWTNTKIDPDYHYYTSGMSILYKDDRINHRTLFVSGNTYSLRAGDYNRGARYAGTDTLTWSSSNSKVASVQATSGGYSATLKALKDGETVIEVRSKVLKGVIARYTINVSTVGDAYRSNDYYGENEDLRDERDPKKDLVTKLVVGVPTVVDHKGGNINYEFTATEEGYYQFYQVKKGSKESVGSEIYVGSSNKFPYTRTGSIYVDTFTGSLVVERTRSTSSANAFASRKAVKAGEQFTITQYGAWYTFTASEDGFYGIKYEDEDSYNKWILTVYDPVKEDDVVQVGKEPRNSEIQSPAMGSIYQLKKDQLVYLKANIYSSEPISAKIEKVTFDPLKAGGDPAKLSRYSSKWYEFTAAEAGEYVVAKKGYLEDYYDSEEKISLYDADGKELTADSDYEVYDYENYNWKYDGYSYILTANQKVYVYIQSSWDLMEVEVFKKPAEPATP